MRVINLRGLSLDTLTPALSLTGRGGFYDTLLREKERMKGVINQNVKLFSSPHLNPLPEGGGGKWDSCDRRVYTGWTPSLPVVRASAAGRRRRVRILPPWLLLFFLEWGDSANRRARQPWCRNSGPIRCTR